jgi:hypothetical protein
MSSVENIKLGQWLIVTYDRDYEATLEKMNNLPFGQIAAPRIKYTGIPYKVIALSYPFALVQVGKNRSVIDLRQVKWTKASRKYVSEFKQVEFPQGIGTNSFNNHSDDLNHDKMICPRCGARMIERSIQGINVWHLYCNDCGGEFI